MSHSIASPWHATEDTAAEHEGGQRHGRIHEVNGSATTGPLPPDGDDMDVEITAGQKMLSAMSGSLLTSLLGMLMTLKTPKDFLVNY